MFTTHSPFITITGQISSCPWNVEHKLVRIGIQGQDIPERELPNSNFVFLINVSGSMGDEDKLGLLKAGMHRFVDQMSPEDFLSIVVYAGRTEVHFTSTSGNCRSTIRVSKSVQSMFIFSSGVTEE
jgi:Ca-activated chloride channel family protein